MIDKGFYATLLSLLYSAMLWKCGITMQRFFSLLGWCSLLNKLYFRNLTSHSLMVLNCACALTLKGEENNTQ